MIENCMGDTESDFISAPTVKVSLEFERIYYQQKIGKKQTLQILSDVSGSFQPGQMIAVMGPSGAGKSSLLNILAGYRRTFSSGKLTINGQPINYNKYKKMSAYIMQQDFLLPHLTVWESMMVSANLRLKEGMPEEEKYMKVCNILKSLGLFAHRHKDVYSISGGERKRVAIALELVSNPSIIFLDEPTSGLDSKSAHTCIQLLNQIAKQGRTVICTIHQPNSKIFEMFTHIFLLSQGQTLYNGTREDVVDFMASNNFVCPKYHNIADFIIEVASGDLGDCLEVLGKHWKGTEIVETKVGQKSLLSDRKLSVFKSKHNSIYDMIKFTSEVNAQPKINLCPEKSGSFEDSCIVHSETCVSDESENNSNGENSVDSGHQMEEDRGGKLTQFRILTKRSFISSLRDKMLTLLRFASTFFIAGLISILYYDIGNNSHNVINNTACMFFSMLFLIFIALMPTVLTFPTEKTVFLREYLNNWYGLKPYYLAKTVADLPFQILLPIIYCSIVYFLTGQPYEFERFCRFLLIITVTCLVAQSIGLLLGAVAPNLATAIFVAPVTGIPVLLFCGFFVDIASVPKWMRWVTYLSFAKYSWEGVILSLYGNNRKNLSCIKDDGNTCMFLNGKSVLEFYKIDENAFKGDMSRFWMDIGVLWMIFIILRIVTFISLKGSVLRKFKYT